MRFLSVHRLVLLGTVFAFLLISYAVFTQHLQDLQPCVRCIYQRIGMIGIIVGGLIALMGRRFRMFGFVLVLISASYGYYQADIHDGVIRGVVVDLCSFRPDFPQFMPLDVWVPWVFEATGDCADDTWQFFGITMPGWLKVVFLGYIVMIVVLMIADCFYNPYKRLIRR